MDNYLVLTFVLFFVGAIIAVVEVIVPSGGLFAVAALAAFGGSLYCAYQLSGWTLALVAAVQVVSIPVLVIFTFKLLPRTSIGRNMMLSAPPSAAPKQTGVTAAASPAAGEYQALLGKMGRTVTMLRPSGTAEFDGKRVSVVTNGEMLPQGVAVRVSLVEGNRIVVEADVA